MTEFVKERMRQLEEDILKELRGERSVVLRREGGVYMFFVLFPRRYSWRRVRNEMYLLKSKLYRKYKDILEHVTIQPLKEG